jgi:putative glutamine amidotransferase
MIRVALPFGSGTPESKCTPYRNALDEAGIQPVENATTLAGLDGLVLAGGSDINPEIYGAERHTKTVSVDHARDTMELALLREALDRDLPVLAICRGLQLLNVALGGTLNQHVVGHVCLGQREAHSIAIAAHSELRSILEVDEFVVNSRHHQCLERVAGGLAVVATAKDNVIEAVELRGKRFVLGVQWHPEDRVDGPDGKLFEAFRGAAKLRMT